MVPTSPPVSEALQPQTAQAPETRRRARLARPPRRGEETSPQDRSAKTQGASQAARVLMIDLNNFTTFPTLAIGLLVASLRNDGHQVRVMCPLAHDVPAIEREYCETRWDDLRRRTHLSTYAPVKALRDLAALMHRWRAERPHPRVLAETRRELDRKPDVLLLSAYLQHYNSVREIARMAQERGIPVLLGGPMFNLAETAVAWAGIAGISAVVGAEADLTIGAMVRAVVAGADLGQFPGVVLPDGRRAAMAAPLRPLESLPIPDFSDFPWDRYPHPVIPMMTGRGCQWDKCLFCSDVISANGRSFRTRSVETVLIEMQELSRRHGTANFVFLDLKLNSYPAMFRGLAEGVQRYVQGAEWVGTVHVDLRPDNGLSRRDLEAAVQGGMRRISFGLESGSQRMLDRMQKGSDIAQNAAFIRNAHAAGLSVRCSMFRGFPGETAEDMAATADFLEAHAPYLDRVRFVDFKLGQGTPILQAVLDRSELAARITAEHVDARRARVSFFNPEGRDRAYRRAKARALETVFQINRRHLRETARQFDGIM